MGVLFAGVERRIATYVLAVADGLKFAGPRMVIALNVGSRDGVDNGTTFSVWHDGALRADVVAHRTKIGAIGDKVKMPDDYLGHAMVFRTFEKVSYALVMDGIRPIRVGVNLFLRGLLQMGRRARLLDVVVGLPLLQRLIQPLRHLVEHFAALLPTGDDAIRRLLNVTTHVETIRQFVHPHRHPAFALRELEVPPFTHGIAPIEGHRLRLVDQFDARA